MLSRVVGYYQTVLRHSLEHFFPDAELEQVGDRSFIRLEETAYGRNSCFPDEDGVSMNINWFRTSQRFRPGSPQPFLPSEQELVATIVRVLDRRYHLLYDQGLSHRSDWIHYPVEDVVVSQCVDSTDPDSDRLPAALEALRVAGLTTYENRRVATGAILLGPGTDPTVPGYAQADGAPKYSGRLSAIKSFHRLCDGLRTLFLVDQEGGLARVVDVRRWADQVQGPAPLAEDMPCPRAYEDHARATRAGGHVCVALSPHQEIKVFSNGTMTFAYSDARWRLLDIPTKFKVWQRAVAAVPTRPADLAARVFRTALNLSEDRHGALFVVLRDPDSSLQQLVHPGDQIAESARLDDESDLATPRLAKHAMHHLVRGMTLDDIDPLVLESLAQIDGAVVVDLRGRLLAFGAILRISLSASATARAVEGARTAAAIAASFHGPVLKVSEDGFLTMFLGGRRIWEI